MKLKLDGTPDKRSGKRDDISKRMKAKAEASLSYEQLIKEIENVPLTWLPALMSFILKQCVRRKPFANMERLVISIIRNTVNETKQI